MSRDADVAKEVRNVATRVAHTYGLDIFDVQFRREAAGMVLRVLIDRPGPAATAEESVSVEDCAHVSRDLSAMLDVEDIVPTAYTLEVSSPGLDRPLKKAADYARFVGEQVEVTLRLPFKGRKKYRGELSRQDAGWRLLLEAGGGADADQRALDFALDEVREARLVPVVDFKGRRPASKAAPSRQGAAVAAGDEVVDGGRIQ